MKKINWRQILQNFATRAKKLLPYTKVPLDVGLRIGMKGLQFIGRGWYYLWSMRKVLAVLLLILLGYKLYYEEWQKKFS